MIKMEPERSPLERFTGSSNRLLPLAAADDERRQPQCLDHFSHIWELGPQVTCGLAWLGEIAFLS